MGAYYFNLGWPHAPWLSVLWLCIVAATPTNKNKTCTYIRTCIHIHIFLRDNSGWLSDELLRLLSCKELQLQNKPLNQHNKKTKYIYLHIYTYIHTCIYTNKYMYLIPAWPGWWSARRLVAFPLAWPSPRFPPLLERNRVDVAMVVALAPSTYYVSLRGLVFVFGRAPL